ncbi:metallophosphoesterase [Pontibacter arcticus]|uniref:Metallophosphoesterase n=1 Tax=Pontibacter arcticus TaxID=2080288 RepID=A0A364RCE3_9BACT|nr:metallophosphoesterase [Pontibacter arcticus]RAU82001.1 metallophosphoesterase [Pontibacter arcticus]
MLFYFLVIPVVLILAFLAFSYWQELKYRHKAFYKLSDIGWQHIAPPADAEIVHSVAMIGDVGAFATDGSDPILRMLDNWQVQNSGHKATVVFLGDNLYPVGLPAENTKHRQKAEERLDLLTDKLKQFNSRSIFMSGNHDWNKGRKNGYQQMLRQENYITQRMGNPEAFLPANGCPGPHAIQLAEGLLLVVINTQWWVQRGEKPLGSAYNCAIESIEQFYVELNTLLRRNAHQRVLIAAHHPLYSNAQHGGKFTVRQHIFPLLAANKRFLIPLPIFGSLYPFYRQLFGAAEDMSHRRYKRMRKRLLRIFSRYSNIVYIAGHDHNLQHFEVRKNHFLVSGAGSKTAFVTKGGKATFTVEQLGFFVFNYYSNGQLWMEARVADEKSPEGLVAFRKELKQELHWAAKPAPVKKL